MLGDKTITYAYNGDSLRTSKTVNGVTTKHIWDGNQIALELNSSDVVIGKYIRGINLIYLQDNAGTKKFYLFNGHGDVVQLTGSDGNVTKMYDYDAFGVEKNADVADTNPFRYCGEYFDKETSTYYLRARYYAPGVGRFISEDSYRGSDKDPLSLNLYTYCANNPIIFWDPSGHRVWLIHGTFTSPEKAWTSEFKEYIKNVFEEDVDLVEWSGGNSNSSRIKAAEEWTKKIYDWHIANPNEPIRLIGHSHGGNVGILIANQLAELDMAVDTIITIATPVREYQLKIAVGQHINVYNMQDIVQISGGNILRNPISFYFNSMISIMTSARRTFDNAENVRINFPLWHWNPYHVFADHSAIHSNIDIWEEYIQPLLK